MKSFFETHIWPKRSKLYRLVYLWIKDRALAEDMIQFVKPIREKASALQNDIQLLQKIMREGKEKARASASQTLSEARRLIGINY